MSEANFTKKKHGLGIMKDFSLRTEMEQLKSFIFSKFFWSNFFVTHSQQNSY